MWHAAMCQRIEAIGWVSSDCNGNIFVVAHSHWLRWKVKTKQQQRPCDVWSAHYTLLARSMWIYVNCGEARARIGDDIDKPSANTYQCIPIILTQLLLARHPCDRYTWKLCSSLPAENEWARIDWNEVHTRHKPDTVPTTYIIKCMFIKIQTQMDRMFDAVPNAVRNVSNADDDKNVWNGVRSSFMWIANICVLFFPSIW